MLGLRLLLLDFLLFSEIFEKLKQFFSFLILLPEHFERTQGIGRMSGKAEVGLDCSRTVKSAVA